MGRLYEQLVILGFYSIKREFRPNGFFLVTVNSKQVKISELYDQGWFYTVSR
jgi:hypothetical protein